MTAGHTLHDEQVVDQLLFEAGWDEAPELKGALLDLRCFADGPQVVPSARLAALMAAAPAHLEPVSLKAVNPDPDNPEAASPELASPEPISLDAVRRRKHRRATLTVLVVAASMGAGTAAVAATDPGFRETAQQTITTVVEAVTHGHSGRPAPAPARNPGSTQPPARVPELPAPAQNAPGRTGTTPGESAATPPAHPTKPSPAQRGH